MLSNSYQLQQIMPVSSIRSGPTTDKTQLEQTVHGFNIYNLSVVSTSMLWATEHVVCTSWLCGVVFATCA